MAPGGGLFIRGVVASFLSGDVVWSSSLCDVGACCGRWVGHMMVVVGVGDGDEAATVRGCCGWWWW